MPQVEIRAAAATDLPAIAAIYRHAVLHGTATFEVDPPDLNEMTSALRRWPPAVFRIWWRSWRCRRPLCLCRTTQTAPGLSLYSRKLRVSRSDGTGTAHRNAAHAGSDCGIRKTRLPADDRSHRRFSQRCLDRRPPPRRIRDGRHTPECRIQVRALARHGDDAARPRRGRHDHPERVIRPAPACDQSPAAHARDRGRGAGSGRWRRPRCRRPACGRVAGLSRCGRSELQTHGERSKTPPGLSESRWRSRATRHRRPCARTD